MRSRWFLSPATRHQPVRLWTPKRSGLPEQARHMAANLSFMCRIRMTFPRAYPDQRPGRRPGLPTRQIKAWLDENCGANGWSQKKAALEQSASDAARPLAWVMETYEPSPS